MEAPRDTSLPFFAYGMFRRGQLGFLRLRQHVSRLDEPCSVEGSLRERDGLPILDQQGDGRVVGSLLTFGAGQAAAAYEAIAELEPDKQYRWADAAVSLSSERRTANVLLGRNPKKGTVELEDFEWDGRNDALFTSALEVVAETVAQNDKPQWDPKAFFRLQMAYLLLWSAIERYASLRYGLGTDVWKKLKPIAAEPAFREGLHRYFKRPIEVFRADKPQQKVRLDPSDPDESLECFYQIRSNMAHRGKAVIQDHERVRLALLTLLPIFKDMLRTAFNDAAQA